MPKGRSLGKLEKSENFNSLRLTLLSYEKNYRWGVKLTPPPAGIGLIAFDHICWKSINQIGAEKNVNPHGVFQEEKRNCRIQKHIQCLIEQTCLQISDFAQIAQSYRKYFFKAQFFSHIETLVFPRSSLEMAVRNEYEERRGVGILVISVMSILLLTSNGSACILRSYKNSRPYAQGR